MRPAALLPVNADSRREQTGGEQRKGKPVGAEQVGKANHVSFHWRRATRHKPARCNGWASEPDSLHAMVFAIDHMDAVVAIHNQRPGAMKLTGRSAWPAPAAQRFAVFRELLHAVIAVFHDVQHSLAIERQVIRSEE